MTVDRLVLDTFMARVKKAISSAGSAREEIVTSREEPMPPKAVPTSMPARERKNLPRARKPTRAITSASAATGNWTVMTGTIETTRMVTLKTIYGAMRKIGEAVSARTTCLRESRSRSRYGCQGGAPFLFCNRHFNHLTHPAISGAARTTMRVLAIAQSKPVIRSPTKETTR
jgi:hypothetical protein